MKQEELLYAKTHEWVHVDRGAAGGKIATVGISHFAVESFGEVESVKAVSDLYSPVSGEIVDINGSLTMKLDQLHDDPYGAGWIVKIKLSDESALKNLLDYKAYQAQCAEEGH